MGALVYKNLQHFVRLLRGLIVKILVPAIMIRTSSSRAFVALRERGREATFQEGSLYCLLSLRCTLSVILTEERSFNFQRREDNTCLTHGVVHPVT